MDVSQKKTKDNDVSKEDVIEIVFDNNSSDTAKAIVNSSNTEDIECIDISDDSEIEEGEIKETESVPDWKSTIAIKIENVDKDTEIAVVNDKNAKETESSSKESKNVGKDIETSLLKEKNTEETSLTLKKSEVGKDVKTTHAIGKKVEETATSKTSKIVGKEIETALLKGKNIEETLISLKESKNKSTDKTSHLTKETSIEASLPNLADIKIRSMTHIDYLHLESSDSDEEQEDIQKNVDSLLSSAAILNDIPSGPVADPSKIEEAGSLANNKRDLAASELEGLYFPDKIRKLEQELFYEHVKSNSKRIQKPSEVTMECPPNFKMYRKDERIQASYQKKGCYIPKLVGRIFKAHSTMVTDIEWCTASYSHMFLSSSADCLVKVWDMFADHPMQTYKFSGGVRSAKWTHSGEEIIAGGYNAKAHVIDALSGKQIIMYDVHKPLSTISMHPHIEDVFLCGTKNSVFAYDLRVQTVLPVRTFLSMCDEVLDIVFLSSSEFASSASIVSRDSADRTISVWDFGSGACMSNQVYLERYTCPSLKVNLPDSSFVAQSNGDYIASFSTINPYKMRNKRYKGHKVSGYGVECDISPDGKYLATGDAYGEVYFYNYETTNVIRKATAKDGTCVNRLKWHPVLPSTIATATWDGDIQIWK